MYPAAYFNLFPAFPRDYRAFVAMSFEARMGARWDQVIGPAIRDVQVDSTRLEPHRVDLTHASDSIITEILDQIGRARVIVADITALDQFDGRPVRNQNVFYEIGIAHAVRLPEEVLLFRSDDLTLAFDISSVRVHSYEPDTNPDKARNFVTDTILASLRELDLKRQLAVRHAAERLDYASWVVLTQAQMKEGLGHPPQRTFGDVLGGSSRLNAIIKLLELGAIVARFVPITLEMLQKHRDDPGEGMVQYHATPFGKAVFNYIVDEIGLFSDDAIKDLAKFLLAKPSGEQPGG